MISNTENVYGIKMKYNDENMRSLSTYGKIIYVGKLLLNDSCKVVYLEINDLKDLSKLTNENYVVTINKERKGRLGI